MKGGTKTRAELESEREAQVALVLAAVENGRDTVHDIAIGTGLDYADIVRIVLRELATKRLKLEVRTRGIHGAGRDAEASG